MTRNKDNNNSEGPTKEIPSQTLYCFSPPVMIATMIIEGGLAIYVLLRYRHGLFGKIAAIILILLGVFQLSEYQICGNQDLPFWSRFGLVAITFLPILGLQLVSWVSGKRRFLVFGYAVAAVLSLIFIFIPENVVGAFCGGNYIIFNGPRGLYEFYGAYYFAFLIFSIWELLAAMRENKNKTFHRILQWFIAGYFSFMLPLGIVYLLYAPARTAVASIMCGFAVIMAFILAFQIVPRYYEYLFRQERTRLPE